MNDLDYARVEKAILFLDRHGASQPRLENVARHVGLSTFHFARLFRRWAGLSPKRFLEVLTAQRARAALAKEPSLLGAAYRTGLSGPGRLHDLTGSVYAILSPSWRHMGQSAPLTPPGAGQARLAQRAHDNEMKRTRIN